MKKQLSCAFPIINSNNISNAKGEIEIVLSIEDFGDVENRESFVSQIDQQSNKNPQNYNKPQTKEAKEHINVELEDVQSSQQQFVDQFANVVNSSKQMQNLKSKFEQHNNININKRENIDQSQQLFWEFEVWKKSEEMRFQQQLKEKEEDHLMTITEK